MNISAKVLAITCAIAVREGFFRPGTIPFRDKNPGDLTKWGNHPILGRFVEFENIVDGFEALAEDIEINEAKALTVRAFISKYAPTNENDTSAYLQFVCEFTGLKPEDTV